MKLLCFLWLLHTLQAVQIQDDFVVRSQILPTVIDRGDWVDKDRQERAAQASDPPASPTTPPVIAKCPSLTGDSHNLAIVHWSGQTGTKVSEVFFILTVKRNSPGNSVESTLWRSTDYGDSFTDDSSKVSNATLDYYYINPLNNKQIIFTGVFAKRLYLTFDEGKSYQPVNLSFRPNYISIHPKIQGSVLSHDKNKKELHVSMDMGRTWTLVASGVSDRYFWDTGNGSSVFFEQFVGNYSKICVATPPYTEAHISQFQKESTPAGLFDQYSMVLSYDYMVSQRTHSNGSGTMYTSYKRGPFIKAKFPFRDTIIEKDYLLVDGSEGQLFIAVNHQTNLTSLYLSESKGISFSLTVGDVLTNSDQNWLDHKASVFLYKLEGIRGTYFANRNQNDESITTIVTFDKGATWNPISAPQTDLNGKDTNCNQASCFLQMSSRGITSMETAPGLVWAQGNLGSSVRRSAGTFLSRDGGKTWRWIFNSFYQASFADQGAVMAAARAYRFTSLLQHSCDEGSTWQTFNMEKNIDVIGLLTEPGEKSLSISAFGFEHDFSEWVVCKLNFSSIIKDPCDVNSDYYDWAPSDERVGRRCLLGESSLYKRRKAESCCFNGRDFERPINVTSCKCAAEDFECDFGYERDQYDSPCVPSDGTEVSGPPAVCPETESYNITRGYRKVAGDNCAGGDEDHFLYNHLPCPVDPPLGLEIIVDNSAALVNQRIHFQLRQTGGGVLTTDYIWDFDDGGSPMKSIHGFTSASKLVHSFPHSGKYNVKVTGSNRGGTSRTLMLITVYDSIKIASFKQDPVVMEQSSGTFSVDLPSPHNESYGDLVYTWNWGDGDLVVTSQSVAEHMYKKMGLFNGYVVIKSTRLAAESYNVSFQVNVEKQSQVIADEAQHNTVVVAVAVSLSAIVVVVLLAIGIYYYRRKYGRLEVEYSQLRSSGRGNYVFGGEEDEDNTIGESDETETNAAVTMSALKDED
eukprot:m.10303 g.10303  ORF g.10303 m.10303 type:complete len:970 (+) comp22172_c0_seq1:130-3039(+)